MRCRLPLTCCWCLLRAREGLPLDSMIHVRTGAGRTPASSLSLSLLLTHLCVSECVCLALVASIPFPRALALSLSLTRVPQTRGTSLEHRRRSRSSSSSVLPSSSLSSDEKARQNRSAAAAEPSSSSSSSSTWLPALLDCCSPADDASRLRKGERDADPSRCFQPRFSLLLPLFAHAHAITLSS